MKKTAILLILVMMISLFPVVNVSAANEYYVKGLYEGAYVIMNEGRTVTVVETANATGFLVNPTNLDHVEFTLNDNDPVNDYNVPYQFDIKPDSAGAQTLTVKVYGTDSDSPIETQTINFTAVAGVMNAASLDEDFSTIITAELPSKFTASDSGTANCAIEVSDGKLLFTPKRVSGKWSYFVNKTLPAATGHKVHYYEWDVTLGSAAYKLAFRECFNHEDEKILLDTSSNSWDKGKLTSGSTYKIGVIADWNSGTVIVMVDGVEYRRVVIGTGYPRTGSSCAAGTVCSRNRMTFDTAWLHQYYSATGTVNTYDNFKYFVYEPKNSQSFVAASISGGEGSPILTTQSEIRITGNDLLATQEISKFVSIEPAVDFTPSIEGNDVVVTFNENLAPGTNYTLSLSGVMDNDMVAYNDYTLNFRTLVDGENPPPQVSLLSPIGGTRFYPGDTITLSAEATDMVTLTGGAVEYVEFYVDGVLIEGSRVETPVDNVYTYEWVTDGLIDQTEPVTITARAFDDEGAENDSAGVRVTIRSKVYPEVEITSPEADKIFYSNLGGVISVIKPIITFNAFDSDGTINEISVWVDGEIDGYVENPETATTYTLTDALGRGIHTITVQVEDNDEQVSTDTITVNVEEYGKSGYIFCDDFAKDNLVGKWAKSGNVSITYDEDAKAMVISTDEPTEVVESTAVRTINNNLAELSFAMDMKVSFSDTASERKIILDTQEILTFTADGKITYKGVEKGTYKARKTYNASVVLDINTYTMYVLLDGAVIGSTSVGATEFAVYENITVSHKGAVGVLSETLVLYVGISKLANIDVEPVITLNGVESFRVGFAAGADTQTLKDNVMVLDASGNAVNVTYENGTFTFGEVLKYDSVYKIVVLPDARDINGNGYSGTYEYTFTTPEPSTVGVAIASTESGGTVSLSVDFKGVYENTTEVYLVCAAYQGAKMVDCWYDVITPESGTQSFALSNVDSSTTIEAFVVDSLDDLNSVSDKIYKVK